eukprot:GHVT01066407.1.p2 GENE.GHVT01066407.1~~GHVT01066407.1.p2  ORF type:complete len:103 (+),score=9.26 GHVT01066407.1:178-486(+)
MNFKTKKRNFFKFQVAITWLDFVPRELDGHFVGRICVVEEQWAEVGPQPSDLHEVCDRANVLDHIFGRVEEEASQHRVPVTHVRRRPVNLNAQRKSKTNSSF